MQHGKKYYDYGPQALIFSNVFAYCRAALTHEASFWGLKSSRSHRSTQAVERFDLIEVKLDVPYGTR